MNNNSFNHTCIPYDPAKAKDSPVWEYHMVLEHHSHPDLGAYQSYGIRAFETHDMRIQAVAHCSDITTVQSEIERLTERFNRYQLSPIHLEDAIQDYLAAM